MVQVDAGFVFAGLADGGFWVGSRLVESGCVRFVAGLWVEYGWGRRAVVCVGQFAYMAYTEFGARWWCFT